MGWSTLSYRGYEENWKQICVKLAKQNVNIYIGGYRVPGQTRLARMSKLLLSSRLQFWKPCSRNSWGCQVWQFATDSSPLHSTNGSSAADISPDGFFAAGIWKAPMDGRLTRAPRERWQLLALRSRVSSVPVYPSCQRTTVFVRVVTHSAAVV